MLTQKDLQNIKGVVEEKLASIKNEVKQIKTKLSRVAKDVRYIAKDFDEKITANARPIQKLQNN